MEPVVYSLRYDTGKSLSPGIILWGSNYHAIFNIMEQEPEVLPTESSKAIELKEGSQSYLVDNEELSDRNYEIEMDDYFNLPITRIHWPDVIPQFIWVQENQTNDSGEVETHWICYEMTQMA